MSGRGDPIFLVGFMGAGKSVTGAALAQALGWEFIDLDRLVVERENRSISELLARCGEGEFRLAELRALESLSGRRRLVIACGGGTYAQPESRARIDAMGRAVWLDISLRTAIDRCGAGTERPLLGDEAQASSLYEARVPAYREAPYRVESAGATPEEIAARIIDLIEAGETS